MVSLIAHWLLEQGERPAILSRGYGRRLRNDGVVVVSDGRRLLTDVDHAGDEPFMLARRLPDAVVVVSDDRFLAGTLAERQLGATVHLLDDGFQHIQLARDVDILMTRPGEISSGRVLPMGRLRESIGAAARADVVVVLESDLAIARAEAWTLGVSQAIAGRKALAGAVGDASVVAVAGIARPDEFFEMLRAAGYRVADAMGFADHHRFTQADVNRIYAAVQRSSAARVVTTEKDFVRLERFSPLPFECQAIALTLSLEGWDALATLLAGAIARRREAA